MPVLLFILGVGLVIAFVAEATASPGNTPLTPTAPGGAFTCPKNGHDDIGDIRDPFEQASVCTAYYTGKVIATLTTLAAQLDIEGYHTAATRIRERIALLGTLPTPAHPGGGGPISPFGPGGPSGPGPLHPGPGGVSPFGPGKPAPATTAYTISDYDYAQGPFQFAADRGMTLAQFLALNPSLKVGGPTVEGPWPGAPGTPIDFQPTSGVPTPTAYSDPSSPTGPFYAPAWCAPAGDTCTDLLSATHRFIPTGRVDSSTFLPTYMLDLTDPNNRGYSSLMGEVYFPSFSFTGFGNPTGPWPASSTSSEGVVYSTGGPDYGYVDPWFSGQVVYIPASGAIFP